MQTASVCLQILSSRLILRHKLRLNHPRAASKQLLPSNPRRGFTVASTGSAVNVTIYMLITVPRISAGRTADSRRYADFHVSLYLLAR